MHSGDCCMQQISLLKTLFLNTAEVTAGLQDKRSKLAVAMITEKALASKGTSFWTEHSSWFKQGLGIHASFFHYKQWGVLTNLDILTKVMITLPSFQKPWFSTVKSLKSKFQCWPLDQQWLHWQVVAKGTQNCLFSVFVNGFLPQKSPKSNLLVKQESFHWNIEPGSQLP